MNTKLLSLFGFCASLLLMASCSSSNSVADKALKLVGLGTFAPSDTDRYLGHSYGSETLSLFSDYGEIFDNILLRTEEATNFRKYGVYMESSRNSFFYFSNAVFEKWELVKEDLVSYDLYGCVDYSKMAGLNEEGIKSMKESYMRMYSDYQESNSVATWLVAKDVPARVLRYKLDNKLFASLTLIGVPGKGSRVCAFRIE